MKIAICDDRKEDRDHLKNALYQFEKEKNLEFTILEFSNPESLYEDCVARDELKIVFFDIYMDNVLGTDAAKRMRELGYKGSIIFCTTSEDHALDGFRVQADGYLVKPYTYEAFKNSLIRLEDLFFKEQKRISFTSERIDYEVPVSEVLFLETGNKGCNIYTLRGRYFTWKKMKEFAVELESDCFYQIGRYYIVNMSQIEIVKEESVIIKGGYEIFIPKRELLKIKQDINDFIWRSMRE